MNFIKFRDRLQRRLESRDDWLMADINGQDVWEAYLAAFPEGTNPIYRERTEHDCFCCKSFIRQVGNFIDTDGKSIWNIEGLPCPYDVVARKLSDIVETHGVADWSDLSGEVGKDHNHDLKTRKRWDHFHADVRSKPLKRSFVRANRSVLHRGLEEFSEETLQDVLDLVTDGMLYRGQEHARTLREFLKLKKKWASSTPKTKLLLEWRTAIENSGVCRLRNTSLGQLLQDLSTTGMLLEEAVRRYEAMVAPQNYKRPKALVTAGMIKLAEKKVKELGLMPLFERRHATVDDVPLEAVMWKRPKKQQDIFGQLLQDAPVKNIGHAKPVTMSELPSLLSGAESVEILTTADIDGNRVSLITGEDLGVFRWPGPFTWAYKGDVADSIRARVKAMGGDVNGEVRVSLGWFNLDDLDISVKDGYGRRVYYGHKKCGSLGCELDVDMNVNNPKRGAVENLTWKRESSIGKNVLHVVVHNYTKRESTKVGFEIEVEIMGVISRYEYTKELRDGESIEVGTLVREGGKVVFTPNISPKGTTNTWAPIMLIMKSPDHRHLFLFEENGRTEEEVRGFFNEHLKSELLEHRKVFEQLGARTKIAPAEHQLHGWGFTRDTFTLRIDGRIYTIGEIK